MRRSLLLAAAAGDPERGARATPTRAPCTALAEELRSGERRRALADAIRGDLARATGAHLPRAATRAARARRAAGRRSAARLAPVLRGAAGRRGARGVSAPAAATRIAAPAACSCLALACQASISIVQWGLGVIAPDLAAARYGLSAASLGALINATALGNAVALMVGRRRSSTARARACRCSSRARPAALLLVVGALLAEPRRRSGSRSSRAASPARSSRSAATVSVFHGFPPERRGFALGMRQMSVALGGLLAALLLPLAVHVGGVAPRARPERRADGGHGDRLRARHAARAARPPRRRRGAWSRRSRCCASPGMRRAADRRRSATSARSTTVLTFIVPALRDGGASRGDGSLAVRAREPQRDGRAHRAGAASPMPAGAGGASRRCATSACSRCVRAVLTLARVARGHRRAASPRWSCSASARSASTACST